MQSTSRGPNLCCVEMLITVNLKPSTFKYTQHGSQDLKTSLTENQTKTHHLGTTPFPQNCFVFLNFTYQVKFPSMKSVVSITHIPSTALKDRVCMPLRI